MSKTNQHSLLTWFHITPALIEVPMSETYENYKKLVPEMSKK